MRSCVRAAAWAIAAAAGAGLICPTPAYAHKIQVFAEVDGRVIRGEAYMSGGGRPRNAEVVVSAPDGHLLGRTRTDENGKFTFALAARCDHRFVIDSGDGHRAEYTVKADELPKDLPAPAGGAGAAGSGAASGPATLPGGAVASRPAASATGAARPPCVAPACEERPGPDEATIRGIVSRAVRRELEMHEQRAQVRDIIGGIGYILGVVGILAIWKRRGK
jgi:nickel transport protein